MEGLGDLRTKRSRKHTKNEKIDLNILQKKEKKLWIKFDQISRNGENNFCPNYMYITEPLCEIIGYPLNLTWSNVRKPPFNSRDSSVAADFLIIITRIDLLV